MPRIRLALYLSIALLALTRPAEAQQNRFEPNQTRRTASRVDAGDYKQLFCNEEDWYLINLDGGQRLEASIRFVHAEGDLELELHDARGRLLGYSRGSKDEEVLSFASPTDTALFLRVHNASNAYDLHVGVAATEWTGQGAISGVNCWGSDWYPLELEAGKQVRVAIDFAHADGDLELALRDMEGNELASSTSQDDGEALTYSAPETQRLLVNVWHVHRSRSTYSLRLSSGEIVPDDVTHVLGTERPIGKDLLELTNGDVLEGKILNQSFKMATPYADLTVPAARVAGIDVQSRRGDLEALVTVDNHRFTGFVRADAIDFHIAGFPEPVAIPRERIVKLVFGQRGDERADLPRHQYVVLKNGDHFSGKLLNSSDWVFDLGFTSLPLALETVREIKLKGEGEIVLTRLDETASKGRLAVERFEFELDVDATNDRPGTRLSLHASRLDTLFTQPGFLPDAIQPRSGGLAYDFESGVEPWVAQGNWATNWIQREGEGVGGSNCVRACGANGGNYGDNANTTLTSPALPTGGLTAPTLRLQVRSRLERGPDFFVVRASYDNGQTFSELHRLTGDNEWSLITLPLQPGAAEVVLQLGLTSDGSIVNQGVWVDDLDIVDAAEGE